MVTIPTLQIQLEQKNQQLLEEKVAKENKFSVPMVLHRMHASINQTLTHQRIPKTIINFKILRMTFICDIAT